MEQQKSTNRGGARQGAGRKANDRNYPVMVRLSAEAKARLDKQPNKAACVESLIMNYL